MKDDENGGGTRAERMDFKEAIAATDKTERDSRIEIEINNESWEDHLEAQLRHGGWPDEALVEEITIVDFDNDSITVDVDISFIESVASGCKEYNHTHSGRAHYKVTINRGSAECLVENIDADYDNDDEDGDPLIYGDEYF